MTFFERFTFSALLISSVLLFSSCGGTDSDTDNNSSTVRSDMLEQTANNIILPSYQAFRTEVTSLKEAGDNFAENATEETLTDLQDQLKNTRLAWQHVSLFQFGTAKTVLLRTSANTFPADTDQIEDNIDAGDYTLGSISNQAAAGFPTLGYLLHGQDETNQQILAAYTEAEDAQKRLKYLQDNLSFIANKTSEVVSAWEENEGQNFLNAENAGTDTGSSLGMLVNAMVRHYERFLRDGKVGIPAGVRSAGVPRPTATEAYYGGYSVELALANLEATKRLFTGAGYDGSSGTGLEENLDALGHEELSDDIITELDQAKSALETLQDPLSTQIESNNDPVLTAFQELQQVLTLIKADMTSRLGVTITYQDNDGD
ncbi:imelysin family protein [Fodinibius salsisoli]|uniref:Imelysin family protein n=1 Tax=Fodinibius salsisoli TaxID=2820877 RepID=A0ABT3PQN2_9BACT|nr:imelysin family protein [Fodinibius salsisoli]MCW9708177.1 imelysin family protein [Fodinibius salsisoli]